MLLLGVQTYLGRGVLSVFDDGQPQLVRADAERTILPRVTRSHAHTYTAQEGGQYLDGIRYDEA